MTWFLVALTLGAIALVLVAIGGRESRTREHQGPADQAAPDAPRSEKLERSLPEDRVK